MYGEFDECLEADEPAERAYGGTTTVGLQAVDGVQHNLRCVTLAEQLGQCFTIEEETPDKVVAACRVPAVFSGFDGHFPARPVLPAFCLLRLVLEIAAHGRSAGMCLKTVTRSRFLAPVLPDTPFTVRVSRVPSSEDGWKCRTCVTVDGATAAEISFSIEEDHHATPQA